MGGNVPGSLASAMDNRSKYGQSMQKWPLLSSVVLKIFLLVYPLLTKQLYITVYRCQYCYKATNVILNIET